ncbi:hypothetical protein IWW39_006178 [Coemansia spiralis]|uniref:Uncharacterized protein n=1 Tax=Coemansia spiralis TaxID=417178 RepID=A0A9W8GD54_9FUNG|nr:hypothetical protein IWW39_006178 [Coemansia spiralis]
MEMSDGNASPAEDMQDSDDDRDDASFTEEITIDDLPSQLALVPLGAPHPPPTRLTLGGRMVQGVNEDA